MNMFPYKIKINEEQRRAGKEMMELARLLFPKNRTLMGPSTRATQQIFKDIHKEFTTIHFKTGETVFDWKVPEEWSIKDAYIEHESGKKFAEFKNNNLHVMGYSVPVNKVISRSDLVKKLYTHKKLTKAIPYVTSYYSKDWAFCMSKEEVDTLPEGNYRVFIDSQHKDGNLTLEEAVIKGESEHEIFFSSYLCHPSMANNELSGPTLLNQLLKYIKTKKRIKYTYRFILVSETIGSIAYLSRKLDQLKKNMICGFNLTCVGDNRYYSKVSSRKGSSLADMALESALQGLDNVKNYTFAYRGSDERQYCSPGVDLPVCTFCRSKFGEYDEYHSSADDLNFISEVGLSESYAVMQSIVDAMEFGSKPKVSVLCEPQLGKRGLYPNTSKLYDGVHPAKIRMEILSQCDGTQNIFEISKVTGINLQNALVELSLLAKNKLITLSR